MVQKILAVDDEPDILRLLEHNLAKAGFEILSASDGPEAVEMARKARPHLIILDIMLPSMEGTEVLKALKKDGATAGIPVIMLTARGEELDRVVGFELGADDYIIKPFSVKELLLRVQVLLRKSGVGQGPPIIQSGRITIDAGRFEAAVDGAAVDLTATEFRLLAELAASNGRLLSRAHLVRRVCGPDTRDGSRTIDTHVRRLRMKLGSRGACIETVRGLGYRFRGDG